MTSVTRSLALSAVERFGLIAINLVSYVLVARLLSPADIGLFSVTAALIGIVQVLREFSLGNYLIQAQDLTQTVLDGVFGLSLALGVLAFATGIAASWAVAGFYKAPEMVIVVQVMALNFLLLPFCSIGQCLLKRRMRFDSLMRSNLVGGLVGMLLTISLALGQVGPASLAWASVATNLVVAAMCWCSLSDEMRPRRLTTHHWKHLLDFGRHGTTAGMVTTIAVDINDLVIGRVLGMAPVALLSRAMGLMSLWQRDLLAAARNVALPAFAQAHRQGTDLEPAYARSTAAVLAISFPYYGLIALFPLESLRLLAGPQWDEAAPLVVAFAACGLFSAVSTLIPTLLTAMGQVRLAAQLDISFAVLRVTAVLVAVFAFQSLSAVAVSLLAAFAISPFLFLYFKQKALRTNFSLLWPALWRSLGVAVTALLLPVTIKLMHEGEAPLAPLLFIGAGISMIPTWVVALHLWKHPMCTDPLYLGLLARLRLALPTTTDKT